MARYNAGIIKFSGTIGEFTFVQSKAYIPHVRKKRTKFKTDGEAFNKSCEEMGAASPITSPVYRAFLPFMSGIGRMSWTKMVTLVKKRFSQKGYACLEGFEFNHYNDGQKKRCVPLDSRLNTKLSHCISDNQIQIELVHDLRWTPSRHTPSAYRVTIILVFISGTQVKTESHVASNLSLTLEPPPINKSFDVPPGCKTILVAVKSELEFDRLPSTDKYNSAMQIVRVVNR